MSSKFIMDVSETNFEYEVLAHSQHIPVVVDFWAEWCGPCRMLGPILEKLAEEENGSFRLAKLNVDENPNLAMRYNVSGIPAVKAFRDGQVVAEFVGAQPEPQVRAFLREIAPSAGDLTLKRGTSLLEMNRWAEAEEAFSTVLEEQPDLPAALLGAAKARLAQGNAPESMQLLENFPASREYAAAEKLRALALAMISVENGEPETEDILSAAYDRAIKLIGIGNIPAALDGMLDILRADKHYRNDEVRKVILGLFELLGEDQDITREYRSEMSSILF